MTKKRIPAYPLFVNDPYFSVWSPSDKLNESDTMFWTGLQRRTFGVVNANGKTYSFMGIVQGAIPMNQTDVTMNAFSTDYTFECDEFVLKAFFVSPVVPTELELMARPVCYFTYKIEPKVALGDVKVGLALHQEHCYNKSDDYVIGGGFAYPDYEIGFFGLNRQHPMSNMFDSIAADWGYTYLVAEECFFTTETAWNNFVATGKAEYVYSEEETKYLLAVNTEGQVENVAEGKILVAFDDLCSIYYYGEWLKGYYFRNGKTIFDAIEDAFYHYEDAMEKIEKFQADLYKRLADYDEDYKLLCVTALRQTVAAHKLVEDRKGNLLFLSKECHSNGCIATVDVTYPSMPLFLLYQPELITGMVRPIFDFARMPIWKYDYAPHDAGTYPYCFGQIYGVNRKLEENDKYVANMLQRNRWNGIVVSHPMVYQYPEHANIYVFDSQMPIEECSNMLVISYAAMAMGADEVIYKENYDLLKLWFQYIEKSGLVPETQLCTDDFFTRVEANVNLSIKALVGVKCFALMAERFGHPEDVKAANRCLEAYKEEYYNYFKDCKHQPLSYHTGEDTFSLKYNMAYDVLFDFGIFSKEMREKEVECYLEKNQHLGVPLDNRSDLTKTDWILYACTLTDDREKQKEIYEKVANYLNESTDRVPFGDLYHVDTGLIKEFQNRTVQGGIFILLLKDELKRN